MDQAAEANSASHLATGMIAREPLAVNPLVKNKSSPIDAIEEVKMQTEFLFGNEYEG